MKRGRPLQRAVCLLHANELPLRHLLQVLDCVTSGPRAFSGLIDIAIKNCEELAIVPFEAIEGTSLPEMGEFHIDQRYIKDMFQTVSDGNCPNVLANKYKARSCSFQMANDSKSHSEIIRFYLNSFK
ncbi:hypothetical protein AVEN_43594-1 [Araneus ventricosus]|uniref:Uncharacterized protein n=1 Tax=Araneus ventricosus TaxID=182803 RepID=A0A4Y2EM18_ARAVE|nr:hypothetical protein AVEN_43594-1 [Araneus ventricosus]